MMRSLRHRSTAFLADDDTGFRETARQLLTEDGYAVTEAADGGEALELLSAMADARLPLPEVLILEFVMPRLSGLGVLLALRRMVRLPPTLMMTRFLDPSVDTLAARLGVHRVLRKPVDGYALCAAVAETAGGDQATATNEANETVSSRVSGQRVTKTWNETRPRPLRRGTPFR
jgi:CheY-like chemotaxis protein